MNTSLRFENGDLQSSSLPCSDIAHKSAQIVATTQLRHSSSMGQRSSSDVQSTSEADMRVQMIFFGQIDGYTRLEWMPIELLFSKSTRSSNKSSRIKSYNCLKLT